MAGVLRLVEVDAAPAQRATPPAGTGRVAPVPRWRSGLGLVALVAALGVLLAIAVAVLLVAGDAVLRRTAGA